MEVANASLLDEPTAAGEAMTLLHRVQPKRGAARDTFLVSSRTWPQTRAVLESRAEPLGLTVRVVDPGDIAFDDTVFGLLLQYPDEQGAAEPLNALIARAHEAGVLVAVATDLLALTLLTPPGESGADVVFGNSQRFGVPLGYGGPHAAFFATRETHVRHMPGRIIGVSVDSSGRRAYRMALQTREQHIRREKATSNICTAQALLANMAAMYAVFHGPKGLRAIAERVRDHAASLAAALEGLGYRQVNDVFFDTLRVKLGSVLRATVEEDALDAGLNFRYLDDQHVAIALDETVRASDLTAIAGVFARAAGKPVPVVSSVEASALPAGLSRTSAFLEHPVFNRHHSETEMMRYIRSLERKDIGLDTSMIPLGSCTMKLNAAAEMIPVTWPEFSRLHPFVPIKQAAGYAEVFTSLEAALCEVTGFAAFLFSRTPAPRANWPGLLVIRAWHQSRGQGHRNVVLIPASAHGTNPASGVMAGMKVVVTASDSRGYIDLADLKKKADEHAGDLAALMVTYPSTHGVYEESIREICAIVHEHGGQVYMDGANMNAQVGLTSPAAIGADVCHLNLHKTFAIPHGGGGPGMGPIGVAAHLAPFLPGHPLAATAGSRRSCRSRVRRGAARASC
jgi:glycine dehydrogenase